MERPFFSILMPAYNCEGSIQASLDSVLCENRVPLELIVVDDASTDGTGKLLDAYAERDERLHVLHRDENGGDGPARNTALAEVGGEWLIMLDADDLIEKDALAKLAPILAATAADVVIDRFSVYDVARDLRRTERDAFREDLVGRGPIDPSDLADSLFLSVWSGIPNKIFRMERIREKGLRFQEIPRVGDVRFTLGACALARGIEFIDFEHYLYRINHGESLTWTGDSHPLSFAQAAYGLQDLLVENGLWESFKLGYHDWFVNSAIYNLATMRSYEGYLALAKEFCENSFKRIGFSEFDRSDCSSKDRHDACMRLWKKGPGKDLYSDTLIQFADAEHMRSELAQVRAEKGGLGGAVASTGALAARAGRYVKGIAGRLKGRIDHGRARAVERIKRLRYVVRHAFLPAAADMSDPSRIPETDETLVSVIVPVYNVESYLRLCLDSIRGQSYGNFEAILVDDGSTDSSGAICDEYAAADERFRVIHRENGGLSIARNSGIDAAKGAWLSFVDADDCIHPDFLACTLSAALSTESELAICANYRFEHDSELEFPARHGGKPSFHDEPVVRSGHEMLQLIDDYGPWYYMTAWGKIFDRSIFEELRFPAGRLYEDEFTIPKAIHLCGRTVEVGRVLYGYRWNPAGISKSGFSLKSFDRVVSQEERMAFFLEVGEYACFEMSRRNRDNLIRWVVEQARENDLYDELPERWRTLYARLYGDS